MAGEGVVCRTSMKRDSLKHLAAATSASVKGFPWELRGAAPHSVAELARALLSLLFRGKRSDLTSCTFEAIWALRDDYTQQCRSFIRTCYLRFCLVHIGHKTIF